MYETPITNVFVRFYGALALAIYVTVEIAGNPVRLQVYLDSKRAEEQARYRDLISRINAAFISDFSQRIATLGAAVEPLFSELIANAQAAAMNGQLDAEQEGIVDTSQNRVSPHQNDEEPPF